MFSRQVASVRGVCRQLRVPGRCRRAGLRSVPLVRVEHILWSTVEPSNLHPEEQGKNLCGGKWMDTKEHRILVDPLRGREMVSIPLTSLEEATPFAENLRQVPKSGLHNPFKNLWRYGHYGKVLARMGAEMRRPEVADFFTRLIQRVVPKHDQQARGEVNVVTTWLESFAGDNVRQLARGFAVPGDRDGQISYGYRFPFGAVAVITPFNFPLEIPAIQTLSALLMGNRPLVKIDEKVAIVMEQFLRMAIFCGLPPEDLDFLYADGLTTNQVLKDGNVRNTLFTGSQAVAEHLTLELQGRVRLEDAGFDWKILGPDVSEKYLDFVAWQCDQDAYAFSGQKCSAQSVLFAHDAWVEADLLGKMEALAACRHVQDLTCCPILTWTNSQIEEHMNEVLTIPGSKLLFGGKPIVASSHSIPECYGAWEPTAVSVPLEQAVKDEYFSTWTKELFGPFQVVITYGDHDLDAVLDCCERMSHHLTAAIVTNDIHFVNRVLGSTINGTTYAGYLGRTTGAPQNHWFGPGGDPRAAGIHTKEAIQLVWSCHREIVQDFGPLEDTWSTPRAT